MRKIITTGLIIAIIACTQTAKNQNKNVQIYNPDANIELDIKNAVELAQKENKHVMLQIGGNWCPWCVKLHNYCKEISTVDSALKADYVVVKVNYDKKKKNETEIFKELGFPQRFGFPVLVILDKNGKRIHTQNSVYLEEGKGYSEEKLLKFLYHWRPDALNPENYK